MCTCKKKVSTDNDAIECQWCEQWEQKVCVKISDVEYKLLDDSSSNILQIYYVSSAQYVVPKCHLLSITTIIPKLMLTLIIDLIKGNGNQVV